MAIRYSIIILTFFLLSGCANMSPGERNAAWIAGGILVTGLAISTGSDSSDPALTLGDPNGLPCHPQPDGSCR